MYRKTLALGPHHRQRPRLLHSTVHAFSHDGNSTSSCLISGHDPSLTKHDATPDAGWSARTHTHAHKHAHTQSKLCFPRAMNSKVRATVNIRSHLFWDQWNQPDDPWLLTFHFTQQHTHKHRLSDTSNMNTYTVSVRSYGPAEYCAKRLLIHTFNYEWLLSYC